VAPAVPEVPEVPPVVAPLAPPVVFVPPVPPVVFVPPVPPAVFVAPVPPLVPVPAPPPLLLESPPVLPLSLHPATVTSATKGIEKMYFMRKFLGRCRWGVSAGFRTRLLSPVERARPRSLPRL
jgi:hypothetical protein